jgi:biotin transport system substrate-specific component
MNTQVLAKPVQVSPWINDAFLVGGASFLIAFSAQISIPLPFTPIGLSMQSFMILFLAGLLGSKKGALAVIVYLAQGAFGLPVFIGGCSGILTLVGPKAGYFAGFIAGAYLTGFLLERCKEKTALTTASAVAAGNLVIYLLGFSWLSQFVGMKSAFVMGVLPFIVGDCIKAVLTVKGLKAFKTLERI